MLRRFLICTVAVLLASTSTFADDKCVPIPIPPVDLTKSLFTPQQEQELGEIVAQATDRYAGVIVDEQVTGHMQQIVDRLLTVLPPTDMKVRLIAVRAPVVNAWSTVGGRIYVTRKLIAFVRSEDELAGILAHELGHIVMRQSALEMGEMFRQAGVTSVSDRADIEAKFQRFLDTVERNPSAFHLKHEENKEQLIADRVAMEAMTRAGYLPAALVE